MHVHALPEEGRPAHFTGAIGQFNVVGNAQPLSVAVGEPVTLNFTITGSGNFDYVRCPSLADDPAWKTYVPSSKIEYQDGTRTQGIKTFEQAIIPQKNGTLTLPQPTFSYFDPDTKKYVTLPVTLPNITVTGSAVIPAAVPSGPANETESVATPESTTFLPNRLTLGALHATLRPAYRQTWFWAVQGGLVLALVIGVLGLYLTSGTKPIDDSAERLRHQLSLKQEEDAMAAAVQQGDAHTFFLAARHAIQLRLGAEWRIHPEALTLGEIRQRDPQLAEKLEPLFIQADEVIYSGGTGGKFDLAHWERHVRELLQPQLQNA
jgi:hypothetical protein